MESSEIKPLLKDYLEWSNVQTKVGLIDRTFTAIDDFDTLGRYGRYTKQNFTTTYQEQPFFDYNSYFVEPEQQTQSLKLKLNLSKRKRQVFFEKNTPNKLYFSNFKQKRFHLKNRRLLQPKAVGNNFLNIRLGEFRQKNINLKKHPSNIFLKNNIQKKKHLLLTWITHFLGQILYLITIYF